MGGNQRPPVEEYLTPGQAAALLHVSPQTISRWANEGRIGYIVTLGGHRRFRAAEVHALANRTERPDQP